eukprot:192419-Hanusia_phi.AAC.1
MLRQSAILYDFNLRCFLMVQRDRIHCTDDTQHGNQPAKNGWEHYAAHEREITDDDVERFQQFCLQSKKTQYRLLAKMPHMQFNKRSVLI